MGDGNPYMNTTRPVGVQKGVRESTSKKFKRMHNSHAQQEAYSRTNPLFVSETRLKNWSWRSFNFSCLEREPLCPS